MKFVFLFLLGSVVVAAGVFFYLNSSSQKASIPTSSTKQAVKLGFSVGTLREERWKKDVALFTMRAKELGATVTVQYADEDAKIQESQAENLLIQGAQALTVVANDSDAAGAIVQKAHEKGVKVIAYDRMINKSTVDMFITFDSRKIGEFEANEIVKRVPKGKYAYIGGATTDNNSFLHKEGTMKVLQPLVKAGDITIVLDKFTLDWKPEEAYKNMKQYLDSGKTVDAVIAANDGTAGGVIQALKEHGLAGKIPVAGSDADLAAIQRIVDGTQTVTMYTPFQLQAYKAAEVAASFARGETVKGNGTLNNGTADIVSFLLDPIPVTKENIQQTVIKDGFYTSQDIYTTTPSK